MSYSISYLWNDGIITQILVLIFEHVLPNLVRLHTIDELIGFMFLDIVNQKIESFLLQELICLETLNQYSFDIQMDSIINAFLVQTPDNFQRLHRYIIDMLYVNQLQNIFYTNWNITVGFEN